MLKKKLTAIAATLLLSVEFTAFPAYADYRYAVSEDNPNYQYALQYLRNYQEADDELFESFSKFYDKMQFDSHKLHSVYLAESSPEYSRYYYIYESVDSAYIYLEMTDSEEDIINQIESLAGADEVNVSAWKSTDAKQNDSLSISFKDPYDHDRNFELSLKIADFIRDKYAVSSAIGYFDVVGQSDPLSIYWTDITDSTAIWRSGRVPLWEKSDEEIETVNNALAENGMKARYDKAEKKMIYDDSITETEKFAAAELLSGYGLYPTYSIDNMTMDFRLATDLLAVLDETPVQTLAGDANCDDKLSLADSVLILQYLSNSEKYPLSGQGKANADIYNTGDGITAMDAFEIQKLDSSPEIF